MAIERQPAATQQPGKATPSAAEGARKSRGRRFSAAVLSGLAGFILGAVFWHFVGFWSFVSHVVLKGPAAEPGRAQIETGALPPPQPLRGRDARAKDAAKLKDPLSGEARPAATATANGQACTDLGLDRAGQATKPAGCTAPPSAATDRPAPKADFAAARTAAVEAEPAPTSSGWTVQVDAGR